MSIINTIKELKNLNKNITHLTFGYYFNQQIIIPQNVTHLSICKNFNKQIIIPTHIKVKKL